MSFQHSGTMSVFPNGLTHDLGQKFEISCESIFLEKIARHDV